MARDNLQQLSRQFARGSLSKRDYRRKRADLIEALQAHRGADADGTQPGADQTDAPATNGTVPPRR